MDLIYQYAFVMLNWFFYFINFTNIKIMNFPILSSLILLPAIGSLFIFFSKTSSKKYQSSKYVALFVSFTNFFLSLYLWFLFDSTTHEFQFVEES